MKTNSTLVSLFLAGTVGLVGCTQNADLETADEAVGTDDEVVGEADLALGKTTPPPPYCSSNQTHTGHANRLYWPGAADCSVTGVRPLVIMVNGNGYHYDDYDYLLGHLATNGFIAISIDRPLLGQSTAEFVDDVETILSDFVLGTSSVHTHVDPDSIGLIGHSMGGMAVRMLAQQLAADPSVKVKAVVTLAQNGVDDTFLDGTMTQGYLGMHGTLDADQGPENTYRHFDHAGAQASQNDPTNNPAVLYKAMKLLVGAAHSGFADDGAVGGFTVLGDETRDATKGYVRSFLRFHLQGDASTYESLIQGNGLPSGWGGQVTVSQYRHGGQRRMIDNFEDGVLSNNTLFGFTISDLAVDDVLDLGTAGAAYPHETFALSATPSAADQHVRWSLPSGTKRNLGLYKTLSLRIGQTAGAAATDVFVRVMNAGVWSAPVRLTDHGVIAASRMMLPGDPLPELYHNMGTVRVPLSAFGAHGDVSWVELSFGPDAVDGSFLVDDVEVAESIFF